ncbi:type II and III secretion system protein [Rouxiella silvae]|nr:type II and III secretion system protein [Rouxiella silvae]MBF6639614.1 type II and III secretion system protein [Rouxiella silvae]
MSKSTVLATPRIRVKNGKKAEIHIGEKIPVVSSSTSQYGNTSKVEYNEVGLKLLVTPDISLDGTITMDVDFDLSNLGNEIKSGTGDTYYKTTNRQAKTVLSSENGETQILAGLIKQDKSDGEQGLPWLSHIPLIGGLFGNSSRSSSRTEVILLITPHLEHNIDLPGAHISTIQLGTEDMPGVENNILHSEGKIKLNAEKFELPARGPASQMPAALPDPYAGAMQADDL